MTSRDPKSCHRLDPADEWLDQHADLQRYCQMATIITNRPHTTVAEQR